MENWIPLLGTIVPSTDAFGLVWPGFHPFISPYMNDKNVLLS